MLCFAAISDSLIPPSHLFGYGQLHYLEHFFGKLFAWKLESGLGVPRAALPPSLCERGAG